MERIKMFQVDAFTDELFKGNPAAVCVLDGWLSKKMMQNIAAENNLSETAFIVPEGDKYLIRWFSPTVEVDLCGHATLAAAYVLRNELNVQSEEIIFFSAKSGYLKVYGNKEVLTLDFPADKIEPSEVADEITEGLGRIPVELYVGKYNFMAIFNSEEEVKAITPDFNILSRLDSTGLIITAPGNSADFVSRYFAPQSGINEDPVTGSAHTSLVPYWSEKLGKNTLNAVQVSERKGVLQCENKGNRILISGKAKLFLKGEIYVEE